jgi:hypothetical protein
MGGTGSQPPGYSKKKVRLWLQNGGANATRPLKNGKKLADYGIGPSTLPSSFSFPIFVPTHRLRVRCVRVCRGQTRE